MAIREKFLIKAVLLLGFALVSCVVQGEEHSYSLDFGGRRGLVDTGAKVFDVTKFGAKAHVKTDNAQVNKSTFTDLFLYENTLTKNLEAETNKTYVLSLLTRKQDLQFFLEITCCILSEYIYICRSLLRHG